MCKENNVVLNKRTKEVAVVDSLNFEGTGKIRLVYSDGNSKLVTESTFKRWYKLLEDMKVEDVLQTETVNEEVAVDTTPQEENETVQNEVVEEVQENEVIDEVIDEVVQNDIVENQVQENEIVENEPVEIETVEPVVENEVVEEKKVTKKKSTKTTKNLTSKINRDDLVEKLIAIMTPESVKENKQHTDFIHNGKAYVYIWRTKTTFKAYVTNKVNYPTNTSLTIQDKPNCGYGLTTQITLTSESQLEELVTILEVAKDYNNIKNLLLKKQ